MMNSKTEELFADYLENRLSAAQMQELDDYLANNESAKQELEELKTFYNSIEKKTEIEPTEQLDNDFYAMLKKEKEPKDTKVVKVSWYNSPILKYAAGVIMLLGIFWIGRRTANKDLDDLKELTALKKDVQETKELVMLSMLKHESASERIQAVNYSFELQKPDNEVLTALIKTLNTDPNTNVRTAAAEALSHFGNEKIAREALVQTLLTQNEPTLQITVIDILANLGEKRAIKPMQKLLQNVDTEEFVKRKAQESVKVLTL